MVLRGGTGTNPKEVSTMESQDIPQEKCVDSEFLASLMLMFRIDLSWLDAKLQSKYRSKRRPPHPPLAMFKALIYQRMKQIPSWRKLAKTLKENSDLTAQLGFKKAPCFDSFSEFAIRIGDDLVEELFLEFVKRVGQYLPDFGKNVVAVDATLVHGYCRPRPRNRRQTDPDAAWGTAGERYGKALFVYGSKMQVISDADYELPVSFMVAPANKSEMTMFGDHLKQLLNEGTRPRVLVADAGYDSKRNNFLCYKNGIDPIIAINPRRTGRRSRRADYYLRIQRGTPLWDYYYSKRPAAERIFSRLKFELGLLHVKRRTLPRVKFHFAMCLIAMLMVALASLSNEHPELVRRVEQWRY
jgi:transposase